MLIFYPNYIKSPFRIAPSKPHNLNALSLSTLLSFVLSMLRCDTLLGLVNWSMVLAYTFSLRFRPTFYYFHHTLLGKAKDESNSKRMDIDRSRVFVAQCSVYYAKSHIKCWKEQLTTCHVTPKQYQQPA